MKFLFKSLSTMIFFVCFLTILTLIVHPGVNAQSSDTNISFNIISPTVNSVQYDDVKVVIKKPNSTYQISEVKAKVENKETSLTFNENAYSSKYDEENSGWVGNLKLNGLSRGSKTLEVTVKDIYGNTATEKVTFKYTQPPNLNIITPVNNAVINNSLRIQANSSDVAGEVSTIKVYLASNDYGYGNPLIEEVNEIDTVVDVSKYSGKEIYIKFVASNETGGNVTLTRSVYVNTSPFTNKISQVDGDILDYQDNKILYRTSDSDIKIKDLQNSSEQLIFSNKKNTIRYGYITPTGAMLVVQNVDPYYICDSLFEFKNNTLTYLGRLNSSSSLKVNGKYAIWNGDLKPIETSGIATGNELYLKNIESGSTTLVSNIAGNWMNDVTGNGEVIYWSGADWSGAGDTSFNYNIYKYVNGNTSKLSSDGSYFNIYPLSDGKVTVYEKRRYSEDIHYLILNVDGKEETIATSSNEFSPGRDYIINNNYVAFTKYVNGTKQIFLWKDGLTKQLTYLGTDAYIESLNASGEVIARLNDGYYIIKNDSIQPIKLYTLGLKNYWINNELYGLIGGTILKIEANPVIVTGITLSQTQLELNVGDDYDLNANVLPVNATNRKIKWSSDHMDIVTVDDTGKVTSKKEGLATITAITEDGNKTASCKVIVKDRIAPEAPKVNEVGDSDTVVTGKAEAGSTVKVITEEKQLGLVDVDEEGNFSVKIEAQKAGTVLMITAEDATGNISEATSLTVEDKTAPKVPKVNEVGDSDTVVTGIAEAGSTVKVVTEEKQLGLADVSEEGNFSVKIEAQEAGTVLMITAEDATGNISEAASLTVEDKTAPKVPKVNEVGDS
ncbi:Ig-like domain-containing protein, partial [Sphingomonas sp. PsM26]|nr:Ig-like domain-containing protein [Sphingomonas sp. PsM26]